MKGLLSYEDNDLFLRYFKEYLEVLFSKYPDSFTQDIPQDLEILLMTTSFSQTVRWWIQKGMKESPELISNYYLKSINYR